MSRETILILGATSDIAVAIAHRYAKEGNNLVLAGRNLPLIEKIANDLEIRYEISAESVYFDALQMDKHEQFYHDLLVKPSGVVCAVGILGSQQKAETDFGHCREIIEANYTGCVSILNIVANNMEERGEGFIIGISSVAGDRGRQSNYFYGSAKAAFTAYLSGLRNRLFKSNVHVLTVKPGFVKTRMTKDLPLNPVLTAKPDEVAKDIVKAQKAKKDVLYTKWMWFPIMKIITNIPEFIFKKLKL